MLPHAARWAPLFIWMLMGSSPNSDPGPTNRLADEPSPYLQLHAHNPVDWYPWGDEAFERARKEDKPVFLSVGYSTCYWCHVMEREVFSNPEIAAQLNARFVSIKVDREERPDIDLVYMQATQLMTGSGGWPNSVFLTPDGRPFYAGTYFPPEDRGSQTGFPRLLDALHKTWTEDRPKVIAAAARVTEQIEALGRHEATVSRPPPDIDTLLERALVSLYADYDAERGGFGSQQKFPRAPILDLLLARLGRSNDPRAEKMLLGTLDAMALGGIYDHLGDGFHRYSTEPTWSFPHFEKMLYDNAHLTSIYARAYAQTGRPLYRRVVERTLAYLEREMSQPGGGFASAQDAEVDGVEGASYVWSRAELERILGNKRTAKLLSVYELAPMPGDPEHRVLRVKLPLSDRLKETGAADAAALLARFDSELATLLKARAKRTQPLRDDKVLVAWNALAIRALVDAAEALDEAKYLKRAERAADFLLTALRSDDGALLRSHIGGRAREQGVLDDYAFLADALLALHAATGQTRWRETAVELSDTMLERFEDSAGGGFYLTPEGSKLLVRPKPLEDRALPAGNGVALAVLRRLASDEGGERYAQAARRAVGAAAETLERAPSGLATIVAALARTPDPSATSGALAAKPTAPPSDGFQIPRSQDYVTVSAMRRQQGSGFTVLVAMDEGWHVNANPASSRFLIPTQVELPEGSEAVRIDYPKGHAFHPDFAPEPIQVYEGTVKVEVELAPGSAAPDQITVRYQACDDHRCLAPHRQAVALEAKPSGP